MKKVNVFSRFIGGVVTLNLALTSVAHAHPLATIHAHSNAESIGVALIAIAGLCVVGIALKRTFRKSV